MILATTETGRKYLKTECKEAVYNVGFKKTDKREKKCTNKTIYMVRLR